MASAQISSPLERLLSLCAECHPLLSHFKELTDILAHMVQGAVATWRLREWLLPEAPGRYRSLYRTAAVPYTHLQTAIWLRRVLIHAPLQQRNNSITEQKGAFV